MACFRIFALALLFSFLISPIAAMEGENAVVFEDNHHAFKIRIPADSEKDEVIFESDFSNIFENEYDTVLIQGEMPDPNVIVEIWVKKKTFIFNTIKKYTSAKSRIYPNGRFWIKFKVDPTKSEFKIAVINNGVEKDCELIIYEVEAFMDKTGKTGDEDYEEEAPPVGPQEEVEGLPAELPFNLIRRDKWGANPPTKDYIKHYPKMFTLHHTAGKMPENPEEAYSEILFIQDYHQNARGWIDIGYHFLIDPFGDIFEGRPVDAVGAHVKGHNTDNVGISIMGNHHPPISDIPTVKTFESFANLGRYLKENYEIKVSSFFAHRELGATVCPGDNLYSRMDALRESVFSPPPTVEEPAGEISGTENSPALRQLLKFKEALD